MKSPKAPAFRGSNDRYGNRVRPAGLRPTTPRCTSTSGLRQGRRSPPWRTTRPPDNQKTATAGGGGQATVAYYISSATPGYTVAVDITTSVGPHIAACSTSFTPTQRAGKPTAISVVSRHPQAITPSSKICASICPEQQNLGMQSTA